ncbi:MAG: hypothetical protein E7335_04415 [Clostridiales bacterium]|nr:hypothetical protein [Clostridiales bacterium]
MKNKRHHSMLVLFTTLVIVISSLMPFETFSALADGSSFLSNLRGKLQNTTTENLPFAQRICGNYLFEPDEPLTVDYSGDKYAIEFRFVGGTLYAEVNHLMDDDSVYTYHLAEFTPLSDEDLLSTESNTGHFLIRRFSGFSMEGLYWNEAQECTISLADDGLICSVSGEYDDIFLARTNSVSPIHDADELREYLMTMADVSITDSEKLLASGIVGQWEAIVQENGILTDMYFDFSEDGSMRFIRKVHNVPVEIYCGVYALNSDGNTIIILSEQAGHGRQPCYAEWILTDTNPPILYNSDYSELCLSLPQEGHVTLSPYHERTPSEKKSALASQSLQNIRQMIADTNSLCAVAHVGYAEGPMGDGYYGLFEEEGYIQCYPFLAEIPYDRYAFAEGGEVYCIVPGDENASVAVNECYFADSGIETGSVLFRSDSGAPFIVQGNISDIYSNLQVNIVNEDGTTVTFQPSLSLKDGSLYTGENDAILDFTVYEYQSEALMPEDLYGDWTSFTAIDISGDTRTCSLTFTPGENGTVCVEYWYAYPMSDIYARFEGTCYKAGAPNYDYIMLDMVLTGGTSFDSGTESYPITGKFLVLPYDYARENICVVHMDGDPLLPETDGHWFDFMRSYG